MEIRICGETYQQNRRKPKKEPHMSTSSWVLKGTGDLVISHINSLMWILLWNVTKFNSLHFFLLWIIWWILRTLLLKGLSMFSKFLSSINTLMTSKLWMSDKKRSHIHICKVAFQHESCDTLQNWTMGKSLHTHTHTHYAHVASSSMYVLMSRKACINPLPYSLHLCDSSVWTLWYQLMVEIITLIHTHYMCKVTF